MKDKSTIQSVEKAAIILRLFTKDEPTLTLHEIYEKTDFSKTSVLRFCNTLVNIGFLERIYIGRTPHYRLGIDLFTIGNLVLSTIDIPERADKYLEKISGVLGDNSYLFIERNNKAHCIKAVKGSYYIQAATTYIGDTLPLNLGGGPLAIFAHLDQEKQSEIIEGFNLTKEETEKLLQRLECIRKQGYSYSTNEVNLKTSAIGVPIFNHKNEVVAAFSVGGIETRISEERFPKILRELKEAAENMSREIGWNPK